MVTRSTLNVRTGGFEIGYASSGVGSAGVEAGNVDLNSDASTLSAQGEVGSADLGTMDLDQSGGETPDAPTVMRPMIRLRNNAPLLTDCEAGSTGFRSQPPTAMTSKLTPRVLPPVALQRWPFQPV